MIDDWRAQIDRVDEQIVSLLSRRAEICVEIAAEKRRLNRPILDAARERAIDLRLRRLNGGPLSAESMTEIYRAIFTAMKEIQKEVMKGDFTPAVECHTERD